MRSKPLLFAAGFVALALAAGSWWWLRQPAGVAAPKNLAMESAGDLRVGAMTAPDPPRPGENVATFVVKDAAGRPVRGAELDPRFVMEAMGQMPRMESRGKVTEVGPGVYRATYGLSMAGEWDVHLKVLPKDGPAVAADWRLSTSVPGLAFVGGSPGAAMAANPGAPAGGDAIDPGEGEVHVDAARRQALGIRVEAAEVRDLRAQVRASGKVAWDETRVRDVTFKFAGFVRTLGADFTGRPVARGEVLLTVYSPELLAAQQEYLEALRSAAVDPAARDLAAAARRRLELWDVPPAQLEGIAREGRVREAIPVVAPVSGIIVEKKVVAGSPFEAGEVLFRIVPLDPIWVMASVFQMDLPFVKRGAAVTISNPYLDGGTRRGRVAFIDPMLAEGTRTSGVRIEVANPKGDLKPGMYVDVSLDVVIGSKLAIPESAVLPTGERRVVFVDLGGGRLAPREVQLGARAGQWYEVLSGLTAGDRVVTSGNFLVSSEAKLRSAGEKW